MKTLFIRLLSKNLLLIFFATLLFCCEKGVPTDNEKDQSSKSQPGQAFPKEQGEIVKLKFYGEDIHVKKINDEYVMMGDIILSDDQLSKMKGDKNARAATSDFTTYWPSGIVYYTINSSLPNQSRVTDAITHWTNNTSLTFQVRTNQSNYIEFVDAGNDLCRSSIGQVGGRQEIKVGTGCSRYDMIHEIGHAVGLYHEQSRPDASNYIDFFPQNLPNDNYIKDQFKPYTALGRQGFYFGPVDFSSVMIYGSTQFSANGLPVMLRKDNGQQINQGLYLTGGDMETVKAIYGPPYAKVRKVQISYDGNSSGTTSYYYEEADYFVDFYYDKQCTQPYTGNAPRVVTVNKQLNQANAQGGYSSSVTNQQYQKINGESGSIWLGRYTNYENTNYGDITSGEYVNFGVTSPNKGN